MDHLFHKCEEGGCLICAKGFSSCDICGGTESALTKDCCMRRLSPDEIGQIRSGRIDFTGAQGWICHEKEPPRGFKKLSDRYSCFPVLMGNSKSLRSLTPRPKWKWFLKDWLIGQIEEATGRTLPQRLKYSNRWLLTMIDGRSAFLSDSEKDVYMQALEIHDLALRGAYGAQQMQNAYKQGGE